MTTSLLYVCLDGLGDDPIPEFDGRTPLEAAETPNLDALAARGRTGMVLTVGPGIAPESDIGVFGILGYDPHEEHPGRGVLEALGVGMDFDDGDLAYRVNFATADGSEIIDRRVGRDLSSEEAAKLADEVNRALALPGASFQLRATIEHRGALVIRSDDGAELSAEVTNTDRAARGHGRSDRRHRGRSSRRGAHERVRRRVSRRLGRVGRERAAPGRGEAPGQPDPDPRRR